jgi:integrase
VADHQTQDQARHPAVYEAHVRLYFKPYLGTVWLDRLTVAHIQDLFDEIDAHNGQVLTTNAARHAAADAARTAARPHDRRAAAHVRQQLAALPPYRRPVGAATKQRIRATLRSALTTARKQGKISYNPASDVELPSGRRPKALVWTDERVARWAETGQRPSPVMVWTPTQTARFLDHAAGDRLYALFHLIAFRGLRRGEACGLHWTEVDLQAKTLTVAWQLVQLGWKTELTVPKSDAGDRTVALDADTATVLSAHRKTQLEERLAWGPAWTDTGLVFTREDGAVVHPSAVTDRFRQLAGDAGLPPIRLHDLRHGAATYALAAGAELKVVQEMLGHSTIVLTGDTYTSVLPEVARAAAEGTADLIRRARQPTTATDTRQANPPSGETVPTDRRTVEAVPHQPQREGTGREPEHPRNDGGRPPIGRTPRSRVRRRGHTEHPERVEAC